MKLTKEDKEWAIDVKFNDWKKCVICGQDHHLNAHHIIPREIHHTRHKILNGITLCPRHHRFSRQLSAHQNPLAFFKWMQIHRHEQLNKLIALCPIPNGTKE